MVCYNLAKMGLQDITIIDFDEVEDHNVASQFYWSHQLWMPKVEALKDNILMMTDVEVNTINDKRDKQFGDITIVAVDDMDVRKAVTTYIHEQSDDFTSYFIVEARMGGTSYKFQCFDSWDDYFWWLGNWFPESERAPEICTEKAISFNTSIISGLICEQVSNFIMKRPVQALVTNQD